MTNNTDRPQLDSREVPDEIRRAEVRRYLQQRRAFRAHAAVFIGVMPVIVLVNLLVNLAAAIAGEWSAWWSLWALVGWGSGVAVHGLAVRSAREGLAAASDEEAQIDALVS